MQEWKWQVEVELCRASASAVALSAGQPLRIDDPDLGLKTPAELRVELQRGTETSWSDFNPLRVMDRRR